MANSIKDNPLLVMVEWDDANTGNEDTVTPDTLDALHKPIIIHTLGWVMREDEIGITLCNEWYHGAYRGRTFVPRGMIRSITPYTLTKQRTPRPSNRPPKSTPPSAT